MRVSIEPYSGMSGAFLMCDEFVLRYRPSGWSADVWCSNLKRYCTVAGFEAEKMAKDLLGPIVFRRPLRLEAAA